MDLLESSFSYDCQDFDPLVPTASDIQAGDNDSGNSDVGTLLKEQNFIMFS